MLKVALPAVPLLKATTAPLRMKVALPPLTMPAPSKVNCCQKFLKVKV